MKKYQIIQKPPLMIVGIECRTSNSPDAAPHDIPKLWDRFYKEDIHSKIPNKISSDVFALYCDYESDYTKPYSLIIGYSVNSHDEIPQGMRGKLIPGGSFALFRAIGEQPKSIVDTWGHIWQQTDLDRSYTVDCEVYGDKYISGSPKEVEIYIAVGKSHTL